MNIPGFRREENGQQKRIAHLSSSLGELMVNLTWNTDGAHFGNPGEQRRAKLDQIKDTIGKLKELEPNGYLSIIFQTLSSMAPTMHKVAILELIKQDLNQNV